MFEDAFQRFLEGMAESWESHAVSIVRLVLRLDLISILVFCFSVTAYLLHRSRRAFLWLLPAVLWAAYHGLCLGFSIPDMLSPVVKAGSRWGDDFVEIVHMAAFLALPFVAISPLLKKLIVARRSQMQSTGGVR